MRHQFVRLVTALSLGLILSVSAAAQNVPAPEQYFGFTIGTDGELAPYPKILEYFALLAKQTDRVFADLRGDEPGVPDGMKVDVEGNVYCGGAGGIWIIDPHGKKLGRIVHGAPATTNLAFGGDDWKTLYFTSRNHLGAVNVKIPGIPVPTQKK